MNKIKVWNNEECAITNGKQGDSFETILYFARAGDYLIDAEGETFVCSHAELELNTKYNWYLCFNRLTNDKQIDRLRDAIVYERNRKDNSWTKYMKPFEGVVPLYEQ